MKVFVYSKKDSHTIGVIEHVTEVIYNGDTIKIIDQNKETFVFYTDKVKTRIYQN